MANTTFGTLKINCLRRVHHYNSTDATLLELAGSLINDIMGEIQAMTRDSLFWRVLAATDNTVADQAYIDLSPTDILEVLNVYQATTDTKLARITLREYRDFLPDATVTGGTPDLMYAEEQVINGSGVNIFRLFLIPTPSAVIAMLFDYLKNARFSADGTGADAEFSPLPQTFDPLIHAMFRTKWASVVDPDNAARFKVAQASEIQAKDTFLPILTTKVDRSPQMKSYRARFPLIITRVQETPSP